MSKDIREDDGEEQGLEEVGVEKAQSWITKHRLSSTPVLGTTRRRAMSGPPPLTKGTTTETTRPRSTTVTSKDAPVVDLKKQLVVDAYAKIKPTIDAALTTLPKPTQALTTLQSELKLLNDAYNQGVTDANATTAEGLLKPLVAKFKETHPVWKAESDRNEVVTEFQQVKNAHIMKLNKKRDMTTSLSGAQNALKQAFADFESKEKADGSTQELQTLLKTARDMVPAVDDAMAAHENKKTYLDMLKPKVEKALALAADGNKTLADLQESIRTAVKNFTTGIDTANEQQSLLLLNVITDEINKVPNASAGRIADLANDKNQKKSDIRAKAVKYAADSDDPNLFKTIASTPEGCKLLDDLVADIGTKAGDKTSKDFVEKALIARYDLKVLKGDLSQKALPRLYNVLGMVPDSHTKDNPKLEELQRRKNFTPYSFYSTDADTSDDHGEHAIVLNGVRTGGVLGAASDFIANELYGDSKLRNVEGKKSRNLFNFTTLHEIGHAVDEKEQFMGKKGSETKYGGWMEEGIGNVAEIAGRSLGFYTDDTLKTYPRTFLQAYLVAALQKGFDPKTFQSTCESAGAATKVELLADAGITHAEAQRVQFNQDKDWTKAKTKKAKADAEKKIGFKDSAKKTLAKQAIEKILGNEEADEVVDELLALAPPPNANWNKMADHEAVKWCKAVKMTGSDSGLWQQGDGAKKYAIDGRIYHESYAGKWVSYAASALGARVTNYAFRAPGEWFSEAYALYFLGKLKDGPFADWLDTQTPPEKRPPNRPKK
jgi:hypothetical protein